MGYCNKLKWSLWNDERKMLNKVDHPNIWVWVNWTYQINSSPPYLAEIPPWMPPLGSFSSVCFPKNSCDHIRFYFTVTVFLWYRQNTYSLVFTYIHARGMGSVRDKSQTQTVPGLTLLYLLQVYFRFNWISAHKATKSRKLFIVTFSLIWDQ